MKHSEAADVVCRLIPRMEDETPAAVLLKHAGEHRLAPAQLAKMGQLYNTASTLAANEKERGSAPHLLDVPALVSKYAADYGRAKGPRPERHRRPITAEEVPVVWVDSQVRKVAAAPARTVELFSPRAQLIEAVKIARELADAAADAVMDCWQSAGDLASKVVNSGHPELSFHKLAADYRQLMPSPFSDLALSKLSGTLADMGIQVGAPPAAAALPPLPRDRTGLVESLSAVERNLKQAAAAWEGVAEAVSEVEQRIGPLDHDLSLVRSVNKMASDISKQGMALGLLKEAAPATSPASFPGGKVILGPWTGSREHFENEIGESVKGLTRDSELAPATSRFLGDTGDLSRLMFAVPGAAAANAAQLTGDSLALTKEFTEDGEVGQYLKRRWGDPNRDRAREQGLDRRRVAEDAQAFAVLQDLMIRDEVLSRKPPERVVEAWETIRRSSPEAAGDKGMLRLLLRTALETQGVDIDSATAARKYDLASEWNIKGPARDRDNEKAR